jgi:CRP-like cAMP-binding protein
MDMKFSKECEQYIELYHLHEHLNSDLLGCLKLFKHPPNYDLLVQAQEQIFLYILVSGTVQVNYHHVNGKTSVLGMMSPLSVIGDLELFSSEEFTTSVVTLEESTLLGIEKVYVDRFGYDDPKFLRFIIQNLSQKILAADIIRLDYILPLANRFASYLLNNCDQEDTLAFPSKEYLAGLLGTTRRHLNRVIQQLQQQGMIKAGNQKIVVLQREQLAQKRYQ